MPERIIGRRIISLEKWHGRAGSPAGQPRWGAHPARESRARARATNGLEPSFGFLVFLLQGSVLILVFLRGGKRVRS